MKHAVWGGPSGIIHGWILHRGVGPGWMPVCYPDGAHPGWVPRYFGPESKGDSRPIGMGNSESEMEWTKKPIDCKRCLKRLGRKTKVYVIRRIVK